MTDIVVTPEMLGPVKRWSFSTLMKYEACPYAIYLKEIKKEAPPPKPEDPSTPWVRGNRIHDEAEKFIKGEGDITHDLRHVRSDLEHLHELFLEGNANCESPWGFDLNWQPTGFFEDNVWCRMKLDVSVHVDERTMQVIDWKSGKKFGNELKHIQQGQSYMIGTFMRNPDVDLVEVQFIYTDLKSNNKLEKQYTREQSLPYIKRFNKRGLQMTMAQDFPPKPSRMNCKYCDYGQDNGTGACQFSHIL